EIDEQTGWLTPKSFHDKVTERTSLEKRAGDIGRVHAILFCDLDRVSFFNTTIGHIATDKKVFAPLAQNVLNAIRSISGDDLVGRGGKRSDEFFIFLADVQNMSNALEVASIIRGEINTIHPLEDRGDDRQLNVSIGCALLSQGQSLDEVLTLAD